MSADDFLMDLLRTPSVSGFEEAIQARVRAQAETWADAIDSDVHGNLFASVNPRGNPRVMLSGHCDQIGMLVGHIDADGFVWPQTVGGLEGQEWLGHRLTIWTGRGPVPAALCRKPIHLLKSAEKTAAVTLEDLWIDLGANDREQARALVGIGDPITVDLLPTEFPNGLVCSPGLDNAAGLWVCLEAARRAKQLGRDRPLAAAVIAASTVQEEIGLRGAQTAAHGANPHVAVAVDVTHASDFPTASPRQRGEVRLGGGPVIMRGPNVNRRVFERLTDLARDRQIPHQVIAVGKAAPNEGAVLQVSRSGIATGLIGIPNRYMHSPCEICHRGDLDAAADLLAAFCASLTDEDDLVPS